MNNQNMFQKRAAERQQSKFSTTPYDSTEEVTGNIFQRHAEKNRQNELNKFSFLETLQDIGEQVGTKGISGLAGGYGNILETFGLQAKEGQQTQGEQLKNKLEFDVLSKIERGEVPSAGELMLLSDDDVLGTARLPTSKEVQKQIKGVTGIGEGKTPVGRIAGRGAEFLGEGASFGGGAKALASLGLSGAAGQGVREAGGPEALATGTEIAGSIIPSAVQGRVAPKNAANQRFVQNARELGFKEREIAPLIQSPRKVATLKPFARKGERVAGIFSDISNNAGQIYDQLRKMPQAQQSISAQASRKLGSEFSNIRANLSNTLRASPDKEAAINFIDEAMNNLVAAGATPESLMNFWQDINKAVNWNSIGGGKKQLARLKEPIADAISSVSPEMRRSFENINELYSRYSTISKKLKPDVVDSFLNKAEVVGIAPSALALVYGNPWPLKTLAGEAAVRTLATEMLINPYFQNTANKLVKNFNQASAKGVSESMKQVKEFMERKYPEQKWDFLIQDSSKDKHQKKT